MEAEVIGVAASIHADLPERHAPLKGKALAINGEAQLVMNFTLLWQHLSPWGVADRRLSQLLSTGVGSSLPRKLSSLLLDSAEFSYAAMASI